MEQQLMIDPCKSDTIIIIYPGYRGDADGYNGKYKKIAQFLIEKGIGAVIRSSNFAVPGVDYAQSLKERLREVIAYALKHAQEISFSEPPRLFLVGLSAGAGAVAALASEFPSVEKILLIAPAADVGKDAMQHGLSGYSGELYITVGADDAVAGTEFPNTVYDWASNTKNRELIIVQDCDHQFRGEENGKILSKAFLWAFAGDDTYPNPDDGIKLYE
ncbi:MAG: hypothetical protein Q7S09_01810 [bacterium]|nr:hypothetical protein [bacterium]